MIRRFLLLVLSLSTIGCSSSSYLARDVPLEMKVSRDDASAGMSSERTLKVVAVALSDMKWEIVGATRDELRAGYGKAAGGPGAPDRFRFELLATSPRPGVVRVSRPDNGGIGKKEEKLLKGYVARLQRLIGVAGGFTDAALDRKMRHHGLSF